MSYPPLLPGLPDRDVQDVDACGCCEGVDVVTPAPVENRPGLAQIGYRIGRYAEFRASQLARLYSGTKRLLNPHEYPVGLEPALFDLKTDLIFKSRPVAA